MVLRGPWRKGARRLLGWRELSLGVFAVAPCWELADVPEVWKRLSQVKKTQTGAPGIRESFPKGLSPAVLSAQEPQAEHCCPAPPNGVHTALGMRRGTVPPRGCSLHRDAPAEGISGCEACSTGTCCPQAAWCSLQLGAAGIQLPAGDLTPRNPPDLASATSRPPCLLSHSMPRSQKFPLPTFPSCFAGVTSSCCLSASRTEGSLWPHLLGGQPGGCVGAVPHHAPCSSRRCPSCELASWCCEAQGQRARPHGDVRSRDLPSG